jgi:hypothetical protein
VNLETFVKLFVNHRPVWDVTRRQVQDAIELVEAKPTAGPEEIIEKQMANSTSRLTTHLHYLLQQSGEKMSNRELESCLRIAGGSVQEILEVFND